MWKLIKMIVVLLLVVSATNIYSLTKDKQVLNDQIIRLHVVADTDDPTDQEIKLLVRDEILKLVNTNSKVQQKEDALVQLKNQLPKLQEAANMVLQKAGKNYKAIVSLDKEEFPTRNYETFSLPAGIYDSLRVTIGKGDGQNWWCVVFPELCTPAVSSTVEEVAVNAGFSDALSKTLTHEEGYEVRFWILDQMGKLQNYFHMG